MTVVSGAAEYDTLGNVAKRYAPFTTSDEGRWVDPASADPSEAAASLFQYDAVGRVISVTNPAGKTRTMDHTIAWETTTKDECYSDASCTGAKIVEIRNAFGSVIEKQLYQEEALETKTRYTYDGLGRLLTTEQWDGTWIPATKITLAYDSLGRKISMTDPDTGTPTQSAPGQWRYYYDPLGNLRVQEDPKANQHLQFCYDAINRVTRKYVFEADYSPGASGNLVNCGAPQNEPDKKTVHEYDGFQDGENQGIANSIGQLTFVSDPSGQTLSDSFDTRGRLLEYRKRIAVDLDVEQATFFYQYDSADHLTVLTYPDLEQVRYEYNEVGQVNRLSSLTFADDVYLVNLTYDRFGRPRQISHGNTPSAHQPGGAVVAETREYWGKEKSFLLKGISVINTGGTTTAPKCSTPYHGNGPYLQLTYGNYTPTGMIKGVYDLFGSCTALAPLSNTATYTYDGLGRLYEVTGSQFNGSYRYDGLGNMAVMDGASLTYANPLRPHQVTAAHGQNVSYDANGNRAAGGHLYEFDEEDWTKSLVGIDPYNPQLNRAGFGSYGIENQATLVEWSYRGTHNLGAPWNAPSNFPTTPAQIQRLRGLVP